MVSKANRHYAIMFSMDNFGKWLSDTLEQKNMSQSELASLSGLSRGSISNIMNGTRGRGIESLLAISKALKVHPKIVFHAAGVLPDDPEMDDEVLEIVDEIEKLNPQDRIEALAYIRMKNNLRKKK